MALLTFDKITNTLWVQNVIFVVFSMFKFLSEIIYITNKSYHIIKPMGHLKTNFIVNDTNIK
jgi:hypothetical protein